MLKSLYTSLIIPFCDLRGWRQERSQNWRRRQTIRRQEVSDVTFLTRKHSSKMRTARLWLPLAVGYTYHPGYLPFLVTYPPPPPPREQTQLGKLLRVVKMIKFFQRLRLCLEIYGYCSSWSSGEEVMRLEFGNLNGVPAVSNKKKSGFSVIRWNTCLAFPV